MALKYAEDALRRAVWSLPESLPDQVACGWSRGNTESKGIGLMVEPAMMR